MKTTLTDERKIIDEKIKANQAQYDLDREAAKISALLSKELDKYEYLSGEDLGYKLGVVKQAKFEYSPQDKICHKGLEKEDKKDKKVIKYDNDLKYDYVHNFNKYSESNFNEISDDSKFDTLNKFYKDFKKLNYLKSNYENTN